MKLLLVCALSTDFTNAFIGAKDDRVVVDDEKRRESDIREAPTAPGKTRFGLSKAEEEGEAAPLLEPWMIAVIVGLAVVCLCVGVAGAFLCYFVCTDFGLVRRPKAAAAAQDVELEESTRNTRTVQAF